jgi:PIN domain nuclease of toxin-antitoxin system
LNLLLDAHALLWWLADDPSLSRRARTSIAKAGTVFVSAATVWEIAIKQSAGKLEIPPDLPEQIVVNQLAELKITIDHAYAAGLLPRHHTDPFDRMLVAQAKIENLTIVTRDPKIRRYDVPVIAT